MTRTAGEVATFLGGQLKGVADIVLESVASLKNAGTTDLSYAEDKFQKDVENSRAGCILVRSAGDSSKTLIIVTNPKLAFAKAAAFLLQPEHPKTEIHLTAVIEPDAVIGEATRIGAGSYVGSGTTIGRNCLLYARVVVYENVTIGDNVIIHSGAVIGADGFGFVKDGERNVKFPQVGRVIIEDDVEIGANTCIDRGSLETTTIRRGAKLDNLIQIAHNVEIGENTLIAAQTGISGSSTVGPNSMIGGQVGIGEKARLDANTIIGGQGGVLNGKHIRGGEVLWGTPVRPLKEFLEQQAYLARLPAIIAGIKKKIGM